MEQAGINHHIFVRPSQGMSLLGTLTNVTSLVLHQRRNDLSHRPRIGDSKRVKSIGFADNLEMLGRWNDDFRENERTQHIKQEGEATLENKPQLISGQRNNVKSHMLGDSTNRCKEDSSHTEETIQTALVMGSKIYPQFLRRKTRRYAILASQERESYLG